MTILKFYRKAGKDYVGIEDMKPMIQAPGSCAGMFEYASRYDGIWISDVKIEGWLPGVIRSNYFHGSFPEYGNIAAGAMAVEPCAVAGFKIKPVVWWRTGNDVWRLKYDQYLKWLKLGKKEQVEFLAGLFPVEAKATKKKEPVAVAVVKDEVPF